MPQQPRVLSEQEFEAIKAKVLSEAPDGLDEQNFLRWAGPRMEQAIGEAENLPPPVAGGAVGRFASNAAAMLNPIEMAKGLYGAVTSPVETVKGIGSRMGEQGGKAAQAFNEGRYTEMVGHGLAAGLPIVGPLAADAGEQIGTGDVAGGLGSAAGLLVPIAGVSAARQLGKAKGLIPKSARELTAQRLETIAQERIAGQMKPTVGANKTRFANKADQVAPQMARDLAADGAPLTRGGFHQQVRAKLTEAEAMLDEATDARLAARTFDTTPIINELLKRRKALEAEAVKGTAVKSQQITVGGDVATTRIRPVGESGPPIGPVGPKPTTKPIGENVVPGPNAARVAVIDKAIAELRRLGPVTRYDPIRTIRQAYDGQAKVVYNPSLTHDFLTQKGAALGAADVTGALREALAKWDPRTAAANAQYSVYRAADDVMTAAAEVEKARPKVGRVIMARLTGSIVGGQAGGPGGAVAGVMAGPLIESALASGATTSLKQAALLQRLANAIRRGDVGHVESLTSQLKSLGKRTATLMGQDEQRRVPALGLAP